MSNNLELSNLPATVVGKFNLTLTELKFQALANEAATLVFNEDNLLTIKQFLEKSKKIEKAIEETHKNGKAEVLLATRQWDSAKNAFLAQVSAIVDKPAQQYSKICRDIQERQRLEAIETARKANIKTGIENNATYYAKTIADCKTSADLTRIESIINLEKGRKDKYQEFLPEAIERYNQLNAILKTQKENVKELERLEAEKLEAEKIGNDEKLLEIAAKQEVAETKIEEKKIEVQEKVIEQSFAAAEVPTMKTIFPAIKARRSVWKWKVVDIKETAKKMPSWTVITPVDSEIDNYLKAKKAEGLTGEEPFTVAGVEFYLEKTF